MTVPDATPEDARALATLVAGAMADAWDDGTEYATLPDVAPQWILTSDWLAQRDARIRAEALEWAADHMPAFHDRATPEWAITAACRWLRDRADRIEAMP